MRIICLDHGERRIGVAVSDPLGITAQGVGVIVRKGDFEAFLTELKKMIDKYENVSEIVVGLPKTLKGEIGPAAEKTLKFVDQLKAGLDLPIKTWDERLTTVQAQRAMTEAGISTRAGRKFIDMSAAAFILQSYLDSIKNK